MIRSRKQWTTTVRSRLMLALTAGALVVTPQGGESRALAIENTGAAVLLLDSEGSGALTLFTTASLQVIGGPIQVNSESLTAVSLGSRATLTGQALNIVGAMSDPPASLPVNFGVPRMTDPLANLPSPDTTGMPVYGDVFNPGTVTLLPGFYPNGMRMTTSSNNVTCTPGLYVIGTPGGINQRGLSILGGHFTASNCTFYIAAGAVDISANADVIITPPPLDQGYFYEHISIFQSRTNFSNPAIWAGNSSDIAGTLYFPGQPDASPPVGYHLDLNGSGFGSGFQVIAYRMRLGGGADIAILFDGWFPLCIQDIAPAGGDNTVGVPDLQSVINAWGPCAPSCKADITRDGQVGVPDLLAIINAWGPCD